VPEIETIDRILLKNEKKMVQHDYWGWILKTPYLPNERCVYEDIDFPGGDIVTEGTNSAVDCYNKCLENARCECYTFF